MLRAVMTIKQGRQMGRQMGAIAVIVKTIGTFRQAVGSRMAKEGRLCFTLRDPITDS